MTLTYKTLGQSNPLAGILTDLYIVPAATEAIVEGVTVCNRSAASTTFRLAVSVGGGAVALGDYLFYDAEIDGNCTVDVNAVATLGAGDKLRCYATDASLSFNAFGVEVS